MLQQGATKRLETTQSVPPRQFIRLIVQPRWLAGQSSDALAFVLQAVALGFGALIFVEPLMVMSLPFSVLLRAWTTRQRPGRRALLGSGLCVVGLSIFLLVAQPRAGRSTFTIAEAVLLAIAVAVILAVCLAIAAKTRDNGRAVAFAAAAAAVFGVTAALTKVVTTQLQQGIFEPLQHWPIYAAALTGVTGVLLTQNALRPGALAAPVAVITVGDPLASIALGLLWLNESVNSGAWAIAAEVLTLAVMVLGVTVLARESSSVAAPSG